MTKNKTLCMLAAVCFVIFFLLNYTHYWALYLSTPFESADLWIDIRALSNSILVSLISAFIFYIMIVYLPRIHERKVIRNNLQGRYQNFKKATIGHFLSLADGTCRHDLVGNLCDIKEFRKYFDEGNGTRWSAIANALNKDKFRLDEILVELAILREEISFVLTKMEMRDEQVLAFFKNMSLTIHRLEHSECEYEDVKILMRFMWELFAGWSWVEGYAEDDIVQKLIQKI